MLDRTPGRHRLGGVATLMSVVTDGKEHGSGRSWQATVSSGPSLVLP